jgi:hypothetical protein
MSVSRISGNSSDSNSRIVSSTTLPEPSSVMSPSSPVSPSRDSKDFNESHEIPVQFPLYRQGDRWLLQDFHDGKFSGEHLKSLQNAFTRIKEKNKKNKIKSMLEAGFNENNEIQFNKNSHAKLIELVNNSKDDQHKRIYLSLAAINPSATTAEKIQAFNLLATLYNANAKLDAAIYYSLEAVRLSYTTNPIRQEMITNNPIATFLMKFPEFFIENNFTNFETALLNIKARDFDEFKARVVQSIVMKYYEKKFALPFSFSLEDTRPNKATSQIKQRSTSERSELNTLITHVIKEFYANEESFRKSCAQFVEIIDYLKQQNEISDKEMYEVHYYISLFKQLGSHNPFNREANSDLNLSPLADAWFSSANKINLECLLQATFMYETIMQHPIFAKLSNAFDRHKKNDNFPFKNTLQSLLYYISQPAQRLMRYKDSFGRIEERKHSRNIKFPHRTENHDDGEDNQFPLLYASAEQYANVVNSMKKLDRVSEAFSDLNAAQKSEISTEYLATIQQHYSSAGVISSSILSLNHHSNQASIELTKQARILDEKYQAAIQELDQAKSNIHQLKQELHSLTNQNKQQTDEFKHATALIHDLKQDIQLREALNAQLPNEIANDEKPTDSHRLELERTKIQLEISKLEAQKPSQANKRASILPFIVGTVTTAALSVFFFPFSLIALVGVAASIGWSYRNHKKEKEINNKIAAQHQKLAALTPNASLQRNNALSIHRSPVSEAADEKHQAVTRSSNYSAETLTTPLLNNSLFSHVNKTNNHSDKAVTHYTNVRRFIKGL